MSWTLILQLAAGNPAQFLIDQGDEVLKGLLVSRPPPNEQLGNRLKSL
jgi:hypothetical protein